MKEFLKSLAWVDYFYMVFTDPRKLAAALMRESKSLPFGFIVPAFVSIMDILAFSLLGSETPFFFTKITYGWILLFILLVFQNVLVASLIDTAGQLLGHQGNIKNVINIMNYAVFPRVLLLPAVLIFSVFGFAPYSFTCSFRWPSSAGRPPSSSRDCPKCTRRGSPARPRFSSCRSYWLEASLSSRWC